jgi:isochorismate synthase
MILKYLKETAINKYSAAHITDAILTVATSLGFSVALWKLPDTGSITLIVSFNDRINPCPESLPKSRGFIVNPFYAHQGGRLFINEDFKMESDCSDCLFFVDRNADQNKFSLFSDALLAMLSSSSMDIRYHAGKWDENSTCDDKQAFMSFVTKGKEKINLGILTKVIAARTCTLEIHQPFSPAAAFRSLCAAYPNTFVCMVSHESSGTWLAASPELLLQLDHNNMAHTVSLAGTKRKSATCMGLNGCQDSECWTDKEINEQVLVTEFIKDVFIKSGGSIAPTFSPKVYTVGNICHLKTEMNINLHIEDHFDFDALIMNLHPTPAICGMPKQTALEFTRVNESFDRALYGGFLGPVNYQHKINFFVNIRCMQLLDNKVIVYAGAGITHDSDPESEWEETKLKCEMISEVIRCFLQ